MWESLIECDLRPQPEFLVLPYWESRGYDERPEDWEDEAAVEDQREPTQAELDNHANQLNANSSAYSNSRGE